MQRGHDRNTARTRHRPPRQAHREVARKENRSHLDTQPPAILRNMKILLAERKDLSILTKVVPNRTLMVNFQWRLWGVRIVADYAPDRAHGGFAQCKSHTVNRHDRSAQLQATVSGAALRPAADWCDGRIGGQVRIALHTLAPHSAPLGAFKNLRKHPCILMHVP